MFEGRPIRVHTVKGRDRERKNQNQRGGGRGGSYPPRQNDGRSYNNQGSGYGDKSYNDQRGPRSYGDQGNRGYSQGGSYDRGASGAPRSGPANRYQAAPNGGRSSGYQNNGDNYSGNNNYGYGGNRNYGGQGFRDDQGAYGQGGQRNQRGGNMGGRGNYRQNSGPAAGKPLAPTEDYNPEDETSSERPRIKLLPRTVEAPVCDLAPISSRDKIFGEAKPRDEIKVETERKRQESESAKSSGSTN